MARRECVSGGIKRATIRGPDPFSRERIDEWLWSGRPATEEARRWLH